ncbi:hypothetical protein M378DRAFT_346089 [Amanita muscaria Koide BX008]|uniref:Uncharacterized protein n=1 Tax=Amanita muscaria (strain Koide BX008) TaxID=946122 RepID=A0A0C2WP91_AMAMK|nr:hypothetical protein M378DRAFT_346089 [Amanita muscaria Koide BX008]
MIFPSKKRKEFRVPSHAQLFQNRHLCAPSLKNAKVGGIAILEDGSCMDHLTRLGLCASLCLSLDFLWYEFPKIINAPPGFDTSPIAKTSPKYSGKQIYLDHIGTFVLGHVRFKIPFKTLANSFLGSRHDRVVGTSIFFYRTRKHVSLHKGGDDSYGAPTFASSLLLF